MAEEQDQSQRTEEPTHKKLEDARKKGEAPSSKEVNNWVMLMAGAVIVIALAPSLALDLAQTLIPFLEQPHRMSVTAADASEATLSLILAVGIALGPPIALLFAAALGSGLVQRGLMFSAEPIKPKLEKISPLRGVKRLFSAPALIEFVKAVVKLLVVTAVAAAVVWGDRGLLTQLPAMEPAALTNTLHELLTHLLIAVCAIVAFIAAGDFLYQRLHFLKRMRMSRQEIRDELKQTEGDPHVRARLKQLRAERARQRMMAAVPEADVVITNPTHYAVALKYEMMSMEAPKLVAKGVDAVAERIKETAEANEVPVVENPPLARALFAAVDIGEEVPVEHYKAVAEIIGYVWRLKGKMPEPAARA